jgi:peptidoglycan/LPS O-acetylase OafA/YrhL
MSPLLDLGGQSFGKYFAYFMLGYLVLSNESILQKLDKFRFPLLITVGAMSPVYIYLWGLWIMGIEISPFLLVDVFIYLYGWISILAIIGLGRHYLNFRSKASGYMSTASFPVYIFHQTWIVVVAYYVFLLTGNTALQLLLIFVISIPLTFASYELVRRIPGIRILFGIKRKT